MHIFKQTRFRFSKFKKKKTSCSIVAIEQLLAVCSPLNFFSLAAI